MVLADGIVCQDGLHQRGIFGVVLVPKMDMLRPLREEPLLLLKFIVLGMYGMQVPFVRAIASSNAATATVLQYLMPALLLGYYLLQEHRAPRKKKWFL